MISSSAVYSPVSPKGSATECDSSLEGDWMIFHFRLFKSILFLFIEFHYVFSISYLVLTCYVYYYCMYLIRFYHALFLFLRRISTVLSQGISHGMWLLAWKFLLFSSVLPFEYASSGYYYNDNEVTGVPRHGSGPRVLQKFSFEKSYCCLRMLSNLK